MSTSHPQHQYIKHLESLGRNGDDKLLHVTSQELAGLKELGKHLGIPVTENPFTGLPEASGFMDILPWIAGAALIALTAGAATPAVAAAEGATTGAVAGGVGATAAPTLLTGGLTAGTTAGTVAGTTAAAEGGLGALSGSVGADALAGSAAADTLATAAPTAITPVAEGAAGGIGSIAPAAESAANAVDTQVLLGAPTDSAAAGVVNPVATGAPVNIVPEALKPPTTFLQDVGSGLKDAGSWAMKNPIPAVMGAQMLGNLFTPKPKNKDNYNSKDHPVQVAPQGKQLAYGVTAPGAGFRPGFGEHNWFPNANPYYYMADGGQVPPAPMQMPTGDYPPGFIQKLFEIMMSRGIPATQDPYATSMGNPDLYKQQRGFADGGSVAPTGGYGSTYPSGGVPTRHVSLGWMPASQAFQRQADLTGQSVKGHMPGSTGQAATAQQAAPPTVAPTQMDLSPWVANIDINRAAYTPMNGIPRPWNTPPGGPWGQAVTSQSFGNSGYGSSVPGVTQAYSGQAPQVPGILPPQQMQSPLPAPVQYNVSKIRNGQNRQRFGRFGAFAEGGDVQMQDEPPTQQGDQADLIVANAIAALSGQLDGQEAQQAIMEFKNAFGDAALKDLMVRVGDMVAQNKQQAPVGGGPVSGPGDGKSDSIPAVIDGRQPAALSSGEHVIDANTVAMIGNGSEKAGHAAINKAKEAVRMQATGSKQIPNEVDPMTFLRGLGRA